MANNCLQTKLKDTVQNSNLPYLGQLTLVVSRPEGQSGSTNYTDDMPSRINIIGTNMNVKTSEAVIAYVNGTAVTPAVDHLDNWDHGHFSVAPAQEGVKVWISNYYSLTKIVLPYNVTLDKSADIKWLSSLEEFRKDGQMNTPTINIDTFNALTSLKVIDGINIKGNTSSLTVNSNITSFKCYNADFTGNMSDLVTVFPNVSALAANQLSCIVDDVAAFSSLTDITANIVGTVERLVGLLRGRYSRTTGTIKLRWCNSITFDDSRSYCNGNKDMSWTASTITVGDHTINNSDVIN